MSGVPKQGKYVVRATHYKLEFSCAIKVIPLRMIFESKESQDLIINQLIIHEKIEHPNMIKIFHMLHDEDNIYVVMEYMEHGNLKDYLREQVGAKKSGFKENQIKTIGYQLINILQFLHCCNIAYGNVNMEHILIRKVDEAGQLIHIKLTGSGEFKQITEEHQRDVMKGKCVDTKTKGENKLEDYYYMAPEVIRSRKNLISTSDTFSACVCLYILFRAKYPFKGINSDEIYREM